LRRVLRLVEHRWSNRRDARILTERRGQPSGCARRAALIDAHEQRAVEAGAEPVGEKVVGAGGGGGSGGASWVWGRHPWSRAGPPARGARGRRDRRPSSR